MEKQLTTNFPSEVSKIKFLISSFKRKFFKNRITKLIFSVSLFTALIIFSVFGYYLYSLITKGNGMATLVNEKLISKKESENTADIGSINDSGISNNGDISGDYSLQDPYFDMDRVEEKLLDIISNGIPDDKYLNDIFYIWSNDNDNTVFIIVYKNSDGPTIFQDNYEGSKWSYDIDRDIELLGSLKSGENLVKDESKSYGVEYYFTDYRKIGTRDYSVQYYEFPPAGAVGRNYKLYDYKNDNLISVRIAFQDINLNKYMYKNAQYYKEYKAYKFGKFPQVYDDLFKKFESKVLENL